MKRTKQIFAIIAVILLAGLYISTLVFALMDSPNAFDCLKASIYATIIIPIMIWAYTVIFKLTKKHKEDNEKASKGNFTDEE